MAYNSIALNNVYNYYLTTYAPKGSSRYDTHKKSELRGIYNSIVKINKEAPLYKLDSSKESKSFAVGIKEDARELRNVIASLGGLDEEKILNKKASYSSNEDIATVVFTGEHPEDAEIPSYEVEVHSLASGQVNTGAFLPNAKTHLSPDTYSFDIHINDLNYEFQYNVKEGESNRSIQDRLAKLISNAEIGLQADVVEDGKGGSALRLRSIAEGLKENQGSIFVISDDFTSKKEGSVSYFGLDQMTRPAANAEFLLNGKKHTSQSNNFSIDNLFDVTLKGLSSGKGDTATIGLKTDVESLTENIDTLVRGYNSFIRHMSEYQDNFAGSRKLLGEMRGITSRYHSQFDILGLNLQENGSIEVDSRELKHAAFSEYAKEDFSAIRHFANTLVRKMDQVSLNPMDYVNKTVIAYKNPGKNYATPYITSAFSGMLFNSYC
jgi:Flagellar capping protein